MKSPSQAARPRLCHALTRKGERAIGINATPRFHVNIGLVDALQTSFDERDRRE